MKNRLSGKESARQTGDRVQSSGRDDPLVEDMAAHFSIFAWEIPWTVEPGVPQSLGWQRVKRDLATIQ